MREATRQPMEEGTRRRYSDEEIDNIYELGRFFAENGDLKKAETIFRGLVEAVPVYAPGWLGLAYIHCNAQAFDSAVQASKRALKASPDMIEAELYLAASLLTTGDFNTAGTLLGEISEKIESGKVQNPEAVRFFKIQMARFELRK